jgi:N-acetylmuramate 1-kinase
VQRQTLERSNALLIDAALAQPTVYVHRDYMPRNLMVSTPNPGILDFQDAVYGPITYDVVSLMRDAFISWEEARVLDWTVRYWERARKAALPVGDDFGEFYKAFEWMGLQRHLKVLGIFARINYRDGKPQYLADTPRFIRYVRGVTQRYGELKPLGLLIDELEGVAVRNGFSF